MFTRVLIANRGEIAVRIARTCRALGIPTAAVFSDADRNARHVAACDAAVRIGPAPAAESYLSVDRIVDAARAGEADAVHPGYGFLSEDPALPAACAAAGLTFIGPPADVIARFGSKINARRAARNAGVPVVPGGEPEDQSEAGIAAAARRTGFPLILKPSAGGGGKGMVTVRNGDALEEDIARARREALATAGDGTLYVERRIERPRHVEVQVVADRHGSVLQLGERDCSTQRRHQKVIEESPAPGLSPGLRTRLAAAAVDVARHAGYENAGTVEFLIDGAGDDAGCYFLEMNTRLQVEHPITELVTGVDLVEAQLAVAAGRPLPWTAAEITPRGHAVECRVYAEDPASDYLPQAGTILGYHEPAGPGIRVDSGVGAGSDVPVHYDPLLAKLCAAGRTREQARRRAHAALGELAVLGLRTNVSLLRRVLAHDAFVTADVHTGFLAEHEKALIGAEPDATTLAAVAAAASAVQSKRARRTSAGGGSGADRHPPGDTVLDEPAAGVWGRLAGWRLGPMTEPRPERWLVTSGRANLQARCRSGAGDTVLEIEVGSGDTARTLTATIVSCSEDTCVVAIAGQSLVVRLAARGDGFDAMADGEAFTVEGAADAGADSPAGDRTKGAEASATAALDALAAPMPATVSAILVEPGAVVEAGDTLLRLEAMKMELAIRAPSAGRVTSVDCRVGDLVQPGRPLVALEAPPMTSTDQADGS